jgi:lipopolysaccharide transport system permease protein
MDYIEKVWAARYFWIHLTLSDLRSRWRRSFFGISWCVIQPIGMTLLLSFVFGKIFKTDIKEYAPYILSGIIIWDFIVSTTVGGSLAFVQADAYIKQCKHPLAIYTLRNVLTNLVVLSIAGIGLLMWCLVVFPQNFNLSWIAIILLYPMLIAITWPLATVLGYAATRFRDIPHALGLVFQAVWFISPVYFEEKVFRNSDLKFLLEYNPIYHLLNLVRAPLLHGNWPTLTDISVCLIFAAILSLIAHCVGLRSERKVIFYL